MTCLRRYSFLILLTLLMLIRTGFFLRAGNFEPPRQDDVLFGAQRQYLFEVIQKFLPSPHSELLAGMTIGVDGFRHLPKFKAALKSTGTVHVVVVSGFNISLVVSALELLLGKVYSKRNFILCLALSLFYALFTGFNPPVVRAWILNAFILLNKFKGKPYDTDYILLITAELMLVVNPAMLINMSFWLSFAATFGLFAFAEIMQRFLTRDGTNAYVLSVDFCTTVSAQLFVWPLIYSMSGTVSLLGFLVNPLILWSIPLATMLGLVLLPVFVVGDFVAFFGWVAALAVYPFLDFFVRLVKLLNHLQFMILKTSIPLWGLVSYYVVLLGLYLVLKLRKKGGIT